jgi:hypothetical protein
MHQNDKTIQFIAVLAAIFSGLGSLGFIIFLTITLHDSASQPTGLARSKPLTVSFLVLLWLTVLPFGVILSYDLTQYFMRYSGYKRWAATFKEDWIPGRRDRYR